MRSCYLPLERWTFAVNNLADKSNINPETKKIKTVWCVRQIIMISYLQAVAKTVTFDSGESQHAKKHRYRIRLFATMTNLNFVKWRLLFLSEVIRSCFLLFYFWFTVGTIYCVESEITISAQHFWTFKFWQLLMGQTLVFFIKHLYNICKFNST